MKSNESLLHHFLRDGIGAGDEMGESDHGRPVLPVDGLKGRQWRLGSACSVADVRSHYVIAHFTLT